MGVLSCVDLESRLALPQTPPDLMNLACTNPSYASSHTSSASDPSSSTASSSAPSFASSSASAASSGRQPFSSQDHRSSFWPRQQHPAPPISPPMSSYDRVPFSSSTVPFSSSSPSVSSASSGASNGRNTGSMPATTAAPSLANSSSRDFVRDSSFAPASASATNGVRTPPLSAAAVAAAALAGYDRPRSRSSAGSPHVRPIGLGPGGSSDNNSHDAAALPAPLSQSSSSAASSTQLQQQLLPSLSDLFGPPQPPPRPLQPSPLERTFGPASGSASALAPALTPTPAPSLCSPPGPPLSSASYFPSSSKATSGPPLLVSSPRARSSTVSHTPRSLYDLARSADERQAYPAPPPPHQQQQQARPLSPVSGSRATFPRQLPSPRTSEHDDHGSSYQRQPQQTQQPQPSLQPQQQRQYQQAPSRAAELQPPCPWSDSRSGYADKWSSRHDHTRGEYSPTSQSHDEHYTQQHQQQQQQQLPPPPLQPYEAQRHAAQPAHSCSQPPAQPAHSAYHDHHQQHYYQQPSYHHPAQGPPPPSPLPSVSRGIHTNGSMVDTRSPPPASLSTSPQTAGTPVAGTPFSEGMPVKDGLGPKIWTGTHFLPRFLKMAEVPGEGLCYFYDDGTHCKTVIDGENVNAHWGVTKAGKPRKRLAIACVTCREKKIKCDPDYPRCVQCEKFGRICVFKNAPRGGNNTSPGTPTAEPETLRRPDGSFMGPIRPPPPQPPMRSVSYSSAIDTSPKIGMTRSASPDSMHMGMGGKRLRTGYEHYTLVGGSDGRSSPSSSGVGMPPRTLSPISRSPPPLSVADRIGGNGGNYLPPMSWGRQQSPSQSHAQLHPQPPSQQRSALQQSPTQSHPPPPPSSSYYQSQYRYQHASQHPSPTQSSYQPRHSQQASPRSQPSPHSQVAELPRLLPPPRSHPELPRIRDDVLVRTGSWQPDLYV